ncbi:MAG: hypothetical protein ABIB47_03375 [Candidatus Woesearchaeota archaeon]
MKTRRSLADKWYSGYGFTDGNEITVTVEYLRKLYDIARDKGIGKAVLHEAKATTFSLVYTLKNMNF